MINILVVSNKVQK